MKFVDQRFRLIEPEQSIEDRRQEGKSLNALGSPFSLDTIAGDTPDFFRIGLEECFIEAPTEAVDHPLLKSLFFWVRSPLPLQIAQQDSEAFFQAQIGNGVKQIQRVLIKTFAVVNAREPGNTSKILPKHAFPELLNLRNFRIEAMTSDVETIPLKYFRASNAADLVAFFQHDWPDALFDQFVGRRQPCRTGTDNDDGMVHLLTFLLQA